MIRFTLLANIVFAYVVTTRLLLALTLRKLTNLKFRYRDFQSVIKIR